MTGFGTLIPRCVIRPALMATFALGAGTAVAEGPDVGCYARDYSSAHLAKQPAQVVEQMALRVYEDELGNRLADMEVTFANQGHVANGMFAGQTLNQFLLCFDYQGRAGCAVECDGGAFNVVRQKSDSITIETDLLMVGDTGECGGAVDLAEVPGKAVRYRLNRVGASRCEGLGYPLTTGEPDADTTGSADK